MPSLIKKTAVLLGVFATQSTLYTLPFYALFDFIDNISLSFTNTNKTKIDRKIAIACGTITALGTDLSLLPPAYALLYALH
jgi:hypothetical protein